MARRRSAGCAARSTSTTCGSASGRTSSRSCGRSHARSGSRPGKHAAEPDDDRIHQALLSGLLSHIGLKEEPESRRGSTGGRSGGRRPLTEYLGARGARFAIFPGSGLARRQPDFVMAAELVETSRLWGRQNAAIDPAWAERLGEHLVKRSYSEPHWSQKRAAVMALRAGHAVRRPAGRRPAGQLRQGRPRSWPASCSSGTRWCTASGTRGSRSSTANRQLLGGGRGARAPRPAARDRGRRAHAVRLLRRPGRRRAS